MDRHIMTAPIRPTRWWLERDAALGLLILAAIVLRLILFDVVADGITGFENAGEATNVAVTLARTGVFGDAYFPGQGPTAHLLPTIPAIAAAILRIAGFGVAGNLMLLCWSLLQVLAGYLLVRRLYTALGYDRATLGGGLLLLCLVPVFLLQEVGEFRYWEGAAAVVLAAVNLLLLLRVERETTLGWRRIALIGVLSGFTFFVSPPAGLGVDACWAWFAVRRLSPARLFAFAAAGATGLALFIAPWAIRNADTFGAFIPLRSNFGLEWTIGADPDAPSSDTPSADYAARIARLHPYSSAVARDRLRELGGEVAYSRALGRETRDWASSHPAALARVSLWHLAGFYVPQLYFAGLETTRQIRASIISLIVLLGLFRLAIGAARRERGSAMVLLYVVVAALPYALVQPIPRYTYLIYALLAFPAIDQLRIAAAMVRNAALRLAPNGRDRRACAPLAARAPRYRGSARQSR